MTRNITRLLLVIAFLSAATIGTAPRKIFAETDDGNRVEGAWYITVNQAEPTQTTFDATFAFSMGGVFTRVDGRSNGPAVGTWKYTDDGRIVFNLLSFNFSNGLRNGAVAGKFSAQVVNGTITGTYTAEGILGLTGFHRRGTFTGVPIVAEGP